MIQGTAQKILFNILVTEGKLTINDFRRYYSTNFKAKEQIQHFITMGFLIPTSQLGHFKWTGKTLEQFKSGE